MLTLLKSVFIKICLLISLLLFIYFEIYKRSLYNHNTFTFLLNKNTPIVTPLHFFAHGFKYSSSLIIYLPRTLTTTVV